MTYGLQTLTEESEESPIVDIIAVSGLDGSWGRTWTKDSEDEGELLNWALSQAPRARVSVYRHELLDSPANLFTRAGFRDEAIRLLEALLEQRKEQPTNILFIGHDIGGSIIKEALIQATFGDVKYRHLYYVHKGILFLGCPHRCETISGLSQSLSRLFTLTNPKTFEITHDLADGLAQMTIEMNRDWLETRLNLLTTTVDLCPGDVLEPKVFNVNETVMPTRTQVWHQSERTHFELPRDIPSQIVNFDFLFTGIETSQDSRYLLSRAFPNKYPLIIGTLSSESVKHKIFENPCYIKWKEAKGTSVLLVQDPLDPAGTAAQIGTDVATSIVPTNPSTLLTLQFRFSSFNLRCNSVESMLHNLLAELALNQLTTDVLSTFLEDTKEYRCWALDDTRSLFYRSLLYASATTFSAPIVLILNYLDESIHSYNWFMEKLETLSSSSEVGFKVVIINRTALDPTLDAARFRKIILSEGDAAKGIVEIPPTTEPAESTGAEGQATLDEPDTDAKNATIAVLELIQVKPYLSKAFPRLVSLFKECEADQDLRRVIFTWLSSPDIEMTVSELDRVLSDLTPVLPEQVFRKVLESKLSRDKDALETVQVLELFLHMARHLNIKEFADMEKTTQPSQSFRKKWRLCFPNTKGIMTLFAGIINHYDGEIGFGHYLLRPFLLSQEGQHIMGLSETRSAQAHARIAISCITYLCSVDWEDPSIKMDMSKEVPPPGSRLDFLLYAVKYWPYHLKRAGSELCVDSEHVEKFLKDEKSFSSWTKAWWASSNRFIEGEPICITPLSILAEHGLNTVLAMVINRYSSRPSFMAECIVGLEAAVKSQEIEIVQRFLTLFDTAKQERGALDNVVLAALSCGNDKIVQDILTKALEYPEIFQNRSIALHRAALLQLPEFVKLIIPLITPENSSNLNGWTYIHTACRGGNLEVVKLLFQNEAGLHTNEKVKEGISPLEVACMRGHRKLAVYLLRKQLVDSGNALPDMGNEESVPNSPDPVQQALKASIRFAHHLLLRTLLQDMTSYGRHDIALADLIETAISHCRPKCLKELLLHRLKGSETEGNASDIDSHLSTALNAPDPEILLDLLAARGGLDPDKFSELLHEVISNKGDAALKHIELLLEQGIKCCTKEAYTEALTKSFGVASTMNFTETAIMLIDKGPPNLEATDTNGRRPLYHAVYSTQVKLVERLIKAGADVNESDDGDGWKPVHAAYDSDELLRMLIEAGADINVKTNDGLTTFFLASRWLCIPSVEELLKHNLDDLYGINEGISGLSSAIANGNSKLVKILLDGGYDPCHYPAKDLTQPLLQNALYFPYLEILNMLLVYNIQVDDPDSQGNTALHYVSINTDVATCKPLIARGATVDAVNQEKYTPLAYSVIVKNVEVAKYLISKGANMAMTVPGGTPFHIACHRSTLTMVRMFVEMGADVDLPEPNVHGTPLQAACLRVDVDERSEIVSYLINDCNINVQQSSNWWGCNLNIVCLFADLDLVKALIERGAEIDVEDPKGRRPIHFALHRTVEFVKLVHKKEEDILAKDVLERNALHFAVLSGNLELVKYVISKNKDFVNEGDTDDWTPLFWALRKYRWPIQNPERLAIVQELLKCGASIMAQGKGVDRIWTPYKVARYYGLDDEVIGLVTPSDEAIKASNNKGFWQDSLRNDTKSARIYGDDGGYCDMCLILLRGRYYSRDDNAGFCLCYKCYRSKNILGTKLDFSLVGDDEFGSVNDADSDSDDSDEEEATNKDGEAVEGEVKGKEDGDGEAKGEAGNTEKEEEQEDDDDDDDEEEEENSNDGESEEEEGSAEGSEA